MAGLDLPVRAIREQVASALHLVVQLSRFSDGQRRVTMISEITGMETDIVTMQEIFSFEQQGIGEDGRAYGQFITTGVRPSFIDRLKAHGADVAQLDFDRRVLTAGPEALQRSQGKWRR